MKKHLLIVLMLVTSVNLFATTYTVNYTPGPNINVTCIVGDVIIFNASSPTATWIFGQPSVQMLPVSTSNSYTVTASDTAYVMDPQGTPSSGKIIVQTPTGINSMSEKLAKVLLFPNPIMEELTITTEQTTPVTIINAIGQIKYQADIRAGITRIETKDWSPGIYIAVFEGRREKIIKP